MKGRTTLRVTVKLSLKLSQNSLEIPRMDFFKSVFSEDPDPSDDSPISRSSTTSAPSAAEAAAKGDPDDQSINANPNATPSSPVWSFGGLIKTLASKSESVIETYRRDFREFGSGLKKEATVISEAVEIGTTVAQESLETVGQAIDDIGASVWKSTAQIISQGRNNLLPPPSDHVVDKRLTVSGSGGGLDANKPYSRFEAQLRARQRDESTYCVEPEDKEEYEKWREGFVLDEKEKEKEIEDLSNENGVIADIYRRVVPGRVADGETFWSRYFYRVHKLRQAEDARARLVKRAMEEQGEEDLRWDFDDEEEEEESKGSSLIRGKNSSESETVTNEGNDCKLEEEEEAEKGGDGKVEVVVVEGKEDNSELSYKDSDVSIVSSQPSMAEEEDLGWDEIEDTGSNYESSKGEAISSSSKADFRKRLSTAEEEEDLSWDIEEENNDAAAAAAATTTTTKTCL